MVSKNAIPLGFAPTYYARGRVESGLDDPAIVFLSDCTRLG